VESGVQSPLSFVFVVFVVWLKKGEFWLIKNGVWLISAKLAFNIFPYSK
jgi:hypothetical protein